MIQGWYNPEENSLQALALKGVDEVRKYLEEHPEVINNKDSQGSTALHYASLFGKLDIVELLINKGADVDLDCESGQDAFHLACKSANLEIAKLLLKNNAKIDKCDNIGNFPIHSACCCVDSEIINFLVDNGANVNSKNNEDITPIVLTLFNEDESNGLSCLNLLIKLGADLNIKNTKGSDIFFISIMLNNNYSFEVLMDPEKKLKKNELVNHLIKSYGQRQMTLINFCSDISIPKECPKDFLQLMINLIDKKCKLEVDPANKILSCNNGLISNGVERYKIYKNFFDVVLGNYLETKSDEEKLKYKKDLFLKMPDKTHSMKMVMVNDGVLKNSSKEFLSRAKKILKTSLEFLNSSKKPLKSFEKDFLKNVHDSGIFMDSELLQFEHIYSDLTNKSLDFDVKIVDNILTIEDVRIAEFYEKIKELKTNYLGHIKKDRNLQDEIDRLKNVSTKTPEINAKIEEKSHELSLLQQKSASIKSSLKSIDEKYQSIKEGFAISSNTDIVKKDEELLIDKTVFDNYLKNFAVKIHKESHVEFDCKSSEISQEDKDKIGGMLTEFYKLESQKEAFEAKLFFKNPAFTNKFRAFVQEKYKPQLKQSVEVEFNEKFSELSALIKSSNDLISEKIIVNQAQTDHIAEVRKEIETETETETLKISRRDDIRRERGEIYLADPKSLGALKAKQEDKNSESVDLVEDKSPATSVKINYNSAEIAILRDLFAINVSDEKLKLSVKGESLSKFEDFLINLSEGGSLEVDNIHDKSKDELKKIFHKKLDDELIKNLLPDGSSFADERKIRSYLYGIIAYKIGGEEGREQFIKNYLEFEKHNFEHGDYTGFAHASGANKETLLSMIAVVDKLLEINRNYQEEISQITDSKQDIPSHPLRIENFHRQLLLKIPELKKPVKTDEKYLEDLIKYFQEYDEPEKFHSSSENLIKERFNQLKQEFIDSTMSELDYVLHNKNENSAIMAQEFSKIFGLKNSQDFEQLQQKFKKGGEELFDDKKIRDYFLNFLKEEDFVRQSPLTGAKTKSKFVKFKEFVEQNFKELEAEYRSKEQIKSGGGGKAL